MPSIASRISNNLAPVQNFTLPSGAPAPPSGLGSANPGISTTLRTPMPNISAPSPDNLKQYNQSGAFPQYRLTPPSPINSKDFGAITSSSSTPSLSASFTTSATTSTTISISGVTSNSRVSLTAANAAAAALTGVYVVPSLNKITVFHPATSGGTFSIIIAS